MILVNITESLSKSPSCSIKKAIRNAWHLDPIKAENGDFIVGVSCGVVFGIYKISELRPSSSELGSMDFELTPVNNHEIIAITNALRNKNKSIFNTKYIDVKVASIAA